MPERPALVTPPAQMVRVERLDPPLYFSGITAEIAARDNAGGRFNIPGATVLYCATTAEAALAETAGALRPTASLLQKMAAAGASADELRPPPLDEGWRAQRMLRTLRLIDPLSFLDIEDPRSHAYLTEQAADVLLPLGVDLLDVPTVRGHSRLLTRALAGWIYRQKDDAGEPLYGGIRYMSRHASDYECWVLFDGSTVELIDEQPITIGNPDLVAMCRRFGIALA